MARKRLTADEVSTSAKIAGVPPALALAIWDQESSGGANTTTSPKGAVGDFQVTPGTFKQYNPTGNISDPVDNMNAALSYMSALLKRYNGDWEKVGQAYYSGKALPPGTRGPTSGPGTPDVKSYGEQVVARSKKYDPMANLATAPARATSTAKGDMYGNVLPVSAPVKGGAPSATPGEWVDPQWHALTAQSTVPVATPQQDLGQLGPTQPMAGGYGGGPEDQMAMQQGGGEYEMDQFIRKLVQDIV